MWILSLAPLGDCTSALHLQLQLQLHKQSILVAPTSTHSAAGPDIVRCRGCRADPQDGGGQGQVAPLAL